MALIFSIKHIKLTISLNFHRINLWKLVFKLSLSERNVSSVKNIAVIGNDNWITLIAKKKFNGNFLAVNRRSTESILGGRMDFDCELLNLAKRINEIQVNSKEHLKRLNWLLMEMDERLMQSAFDEHSENCQKSQKKQFKIDFNAVENDCPFFFTCCTLNPCYLLYWVIYIHALNTINYIRCVMTQSFCLSFR